MEQFTYIYKQGALCGTARAARTIGPRPPAGYGYPEKTAGVPCRRRACPRSSHPARPPSAESPRLPQPGRTPAPFRSNTGKDAAGCAASYLGIPAAPHHRLQTAERAAAHPGTPTRNRTAQRREQGKRQTKRRRWQQRSCGGGRSIVRTRNGVKIMPPAEKRSFFLIFAP